MKNAFIALFFLGLLSSCINNELGGPPWLNDDLDFNFDEPGLTQSITVYNTDGSNPNTTNFVYENGSLSSDGKYQYKHKSDGIEVYDNRSGVSQLAYTIKLQDNRLRKFQDHSSGGYFEVSGYGSSSYQVARWKKCASCETQEIRMYINNAQNVDRIQVLNSNGQVISEQHYSFDSRTNPFFRNYHLPDLFLNDLEYIVRVSSCNNITKSDIGNFRYEFGNAGCPTNIYRVDKNQQQQVLTKSLSY